MEIKAYTIFELLNSLGSLATVGAFFFLFRRDKDKQEQIDRLASIAVVLEEQNETLKIHNGLVMQELEILRNRELQGSHDKEFIMGLKDIEEKKLRLSVKPKLWLNGAGYNGHSGELRIDLNNKGELATLLEFNLVNGDIELHSKSLPYDLEKGKGRYIFGRSTGEKPIDSCTYEIDVIYKDRLDYKYVSRIRGTGASAKISEPEDIQMINEKN